ncbi:unnamed protein product [Amoebophrya sp. A120]|nr:unnamed protein product [Amoebophrya sp. A120]|eukprot:GSA120T00001788001.1
MMSTSPPSNLRLQKFGDSRVSIGTAQSPGCCPESSLRKMSSHTDLERDAAAHQNFSLSASASYKDLQLHEQSEEQRALLLHSSGGVRVPDEYSGQNYDPTGASGGGGSGVFSARSDAIKSNRQTGAPSQNSAICQVHDADVVGLEAQTVEPHCFQFDDEMGIFFRYLLGIGCPFVLICFAVKAGNSPSAIILLITQVLTTMNNLVSPFLPVSLSNTCTSAARRLKQKVNMICVDTSRIPRAGRVTTFCFDKTGTLTHDGMEFAGVVDSQGDGSAEHLYGANKAEFNALLHAEAPQLLLALASCHSVTQLADGTVIGNPVEKSMFEAIGWEVVVAEPEQSGEGARTIEERSPGSRSPWSDEIEREQQEAADAAEAVRRYACPHNLLHTASTSITTSEVVHERLQVTVLQKWQFDQRRQRQAVLVEEAGGIRRIFCKGSVERVAAACRPETIPADVFAQTKVYSNRGFYVIAVATRRLDEEPTSAAISCSKIQQEQNPSAIAESHRKMDRDEVECDLEFLGLMLFQNRIKRESKYVIDRLQKRFGVNCVMITGDAVHTGVTAARECQLLDDTKRIFVGDLVCDEKVLNLGLPDVHWEHVAREQNEEDSSFALAETFPKRHADFISWIRAQGANCGENCPDLALTERAYDHLLQLAPQGAFPTWFMKRVKVFGRVKPDGKKRLILHIQQTERDGLVGMVGDGGNDTVALKQADIGVALIHGYAKKTDHKDDDEEQSSNQSVVAPFMVRSRPPCEEDGEAHEDGIAAIVALLLEGRCALETSMRIFLWFISFGIVWVLTMKVLMLLSNAFAPMAAWFYADAFLTTLVPWAMTLAEPAESHLTTPRRGAENETAVNKGSPDSTISVKAEQVSKNENKEVHKALSRSCSADCQLPRKPVVVPPPQCGFLHRHFLWRLGLAVSAGMCTLAVPYLYANLCDSVGYFRVYFGRDDIETGAEIGPRTQNYDNALIFLNQAFFGLLLAAALSQKSRLRAGMLPSLCVSKKATSTAAGTDSIFLRYNRRRNWVLIAVLLALMLPALVPVIFVRPNVINCVWHINCDNRTWQAMWGYETQYHGPGQSVINLQDDIRQPVWALSTSSVVQLSPPAPRPDSTPSGKLQLALVFSTFPSTSPDRQQPRPARQTDPSQVLQRHRLQCKNFLTQDDRAFSFRGNSVKAEGLEVYHYATQVRGHAQAGEEGRTSLCMISLKVSSATTQGTPAGEQQDAVAEPSPTVCASVCQQTWHAGRRKEDFGCRFSLYSTSQGRCLLFSTDDVGLAEGIFTRQPQTNLARRSSMTLFSRSRGNYQGTTPEAPTSRSRIVHLARWTELEKEVRGENIPLPPSAPLTHVGDWVVESLERHNEFGRQQDNSRDFSFYAVFVATYAFAAALLFAVFAAC